MSAVRICRWLLVALFFLPTVRADYELAKVRERRVLLLSGSVLRLEGAPTALHVASLGRAFRIDRMFLLDRIASQEIDAGESTSAERRIREVSASVGAGSRERILIELVFTEGAGDFAVSYLAVFRAEAEFRRQYRERAVQDRIDLPVAAPRDPAELDAKLSAHSEVVLKELAARR